MSAWLLAQNLIMGGNLNVADITSQIKATIFSDDCLSTPKVTHLKGFYPIKTDTSEKPDNGHGGVLCQNAESIQTSSNGRLYC